jgi:hypothetical protein
MLSALKEDRAHAQGTIHRTSSPFPAVSARRTIRLNSGTSLWLGYFTDATRDPRTVSVGVGRSADGGRKFTWIKGNVAFPQETIP